MARRVILDIGIIVAFERGKLDIDLVLGADDAAMAHVEAILSGVPIVDYTLEVARVHARLAVHAIDLGKPRSAYDMIVAATAVAEGRTLLATDASAGFTELPGVAAELIAVD